ncbi:MAG: phosphotransferase [Gammaproteobacteria bacterium]|nr:phosphotransferase [Gammaproteobacteria bacterium]MBT5154275.1 phosphotransferase [Gammaproteobacteria bacterium]MBT6585531.1 phosphotransferase [Gammaproteobacteria bacterium]MBT6891914.1 phosphotransferase [Gammaproteobacteria bacterium]MDG1231986.1 phosphotransferase [Pseudomonadales bacterium]
MTIPGSMTDVSPQWVEECVGRGKLKNISLAPIGEGVGMMSSMSIIELEWEDSKDMPSSLVLKLAAENDTNRAVSQQFNLYLKEVSYYKDLAPRTTARSPRVYASEIDEEHNFFLLMEDVSSYRMGSQVEGATREECELCVDFLVNLHASFWNQLSDVEWLPNMSGSDNATNMALGCEAGWPQLQAIFGEFVPDNIEAQRERYLAAVPTLQAQLDQHPKTLIHGDFRMDNMLFGQAPAHDPLLVVDFQGPLKGNGIHDVAYLLSHSAKTEVRQEYERSLIERYANGLTRAGIKDYSVEKAWNDYRVGVLYSWTVAVVIAGTLDPANDRGFAWMSKMVERNGLAINDLNCLDLLI